LIPTIVKKPIVHVYEVMKELVLVSFTATQSNKVIYYSKIFSTS